VEGIRSGDPKRLLDFVEETEELENYADSRVLNAICGRLSCLQMQQQLRARADAAEERAETASVLRALKNSTSGCQGSSSV